ncbi:MAG: amidohydrolase, partial [Acidobacteriota bacterium]
EDGRATGRLSPDAAERVLERRPEKSMERRLAEADTALDRLLASGVTTFHDITPARQMRVYQELKRRGDLRVRVYARPTLDRWEELRAVGLEQGFGDRWLRIGTLKGFVDGIMGNSSARFYEPYLTSGERGRWRTMMTEPPGMRELMAGADTSGFWMGIHAIGDQAIDTLLTMYEATVADRSRGATGEPADGVGATEDPPAGAAPGPEGRRDRVIHAQVLRDSTVADRMAELGLTAEVQPYHAIDDMRWMEERIGAERSRWAYAFRTLRDAGVRLSFGSDWPGTNAAWYPSSPVLGLYAAVTRKTLTGEPEEGWFPRERVDVETALRAYTVHNAWAEGAETEKGTIEPGKLADLVVLDRSPFRVPPDSLKHLKVLTTVVDGRVAFEASPEEAREALHWAEKPGLE